MNSDQLARNAMQAGRLAEAYGLFIESGGAEGFANAGICAARLGDAPQAVAAFRQAVRLDPKDANLARFLGLSCFDAGEYSDAYTHLAPFRDPDALFARANAAVRLGLLTEAEGLYRQALKLRPSWPAAWINLGIALETHDPSAAERAFEQAIKLEPKNSLALESLANLYRTTGRAEASIPLYYRVLAVEPENLSIRMALGQAQQLAAKFDDALTSYRAVRTAAPAQFSAALNEAQILAERGDYEEANGILSGDLPTWTSWRRALAMPVIPDSATQIASVRQKLDDFLSRPDLPALDNPVEQIAAPGFYLAYHGLNNRELASRIASRILEACPRLADPIAINPSQEKPVLVIASAHLRDHTVGLITLGIIQKLPRNQFEVVVVRPQGPEDHVTVQIRRVADEFHSVSRDPVAARHEIAALQPNAIYFPDIGMEPWSYYLGFARMAPFQCTGWGHADTTGLPEIDAYLTTSDFDPAEADGFYSERLIRLPRIPMYLPRFARPKPKSTNRSDRLYLCPQSLFKIHPDLDLAFGEILRRDPNGVIGLPVGLHPQWQTRLEARFARTIPDVCHRVTFVPRVKPADFSAWLASADAVIDPIHFTGGYTSYQAIGAGIPVVTWNGDHLPGRMTAAMYQQAGIEGLTANSPEEYGRIAVEIAKSPEVKSQRMSEILDRGRSLFEDQSAIDAFSSAILSEIRR